jgi:hypothetical protein
MPGHRRRADDACTARRGKARHGPECCCGWL